MILLVSFVTSSLKTGWKSEVDYLLIHDCKGRNFTGKVCNNVKFCNIFCLNSNLGVSLRAGLFAHTARALVTGRYPLPSLTQNFDKKRAIF